MGHNQGTWADTRVLLSGRSDQFCFCRNEDVGATSVVPAQTCPAANTAFLPTFISHVGYTFPSTAKPKRSHTATQHTGHWNALLRQPKRLKSQR